MKKVLSFISSVVALVCISCTKESTELTYANQETKIDEFVTSTLQKDSTYHVSYNKGAVRITIQDGSGAELEKNSVASIYYAGYTFNGGLSSSNLFATNIKDIAKSSGWSLSDDSIFVPVSVKLSDKDLVEGLANGLVGAQAGEECIILFSGKYGFGKKSYGTISANSAIAYHVLVAEILD